MTVRSCLAPGACDTSLQGRLCRSCNMAHINAIKWGRDPDLQAERSAWRERLQVDECDRHLVAGERYRVEFNRKTGDYIRVRLKCRATGRRSMLSRVIMDAPDRMVVDHINGDTLDNRRINLRVCTPRQNTMNMRAFRQNQFGHVPASLFKGVGRDGTGWKAQIKNANVSVYLGTFKTELAAAHAYDDAARKLYGQFAALNFPQDGEVGCLARGSQAGTSHSRPGQPIHDACCDMPDALASSASDRPFHVQKVAHD